MFSHRFARVATAAVGALVLSTLSIAAAIGPARAVETDRTIIAMADASVQSGARANG
jgi:hypothetical protein